MTGKRLFINIWFYLLLGLLPAGSAAAGAGSVAVLLSDSLEIYQAPVAIFSAEVGFEVQQYNLRGDLKRAPEIKQKIFADKPSLILAVGAKAAYVTKVWTQKHQEIPVIFTMVLNWQRYKLLEEQENITGISMEIAPGTQFGNMALFTPKARRIGVIYSEQHSSELLKQARQAAAILNLELIAEPISHPKDFKRSFKALAPRVDGFWMLNDPLVLSLDNADWLKERCINNQLICAGQSEKMAQYGLLLTINPDIHNIGAQAASMARNILLRRQKPKEIGVMPPLGTQISINLETAGKIGLPQDQIPINLATNIFGSLSDN
ncbi:MAG: hypothetical protein KAI35_09350 [Desulfobulbaceae bacterium]|nr:hypothetical protein [Desulfobulbaceae bacterium]